MSLERLMGRIGFTMVFDRGARPTDEAANEGIRQELAREARVKRALP
jgi:hypothetical protein